MDAENVNRRTQAETPGCSSQFLQRHQIEGDQSLDHIVTGDEIWISYCSCREQIY